MASSPSRDSEPPASPENVLTPSRKVQALLAAFEDSDSEYDAISPKKSRILQQTEPEADAGEAEQSSEDEDDLLPGRPSRMAARLQGNGQAALKQSTRLELQSAAGDEVGAHEVESETAQQSLVSSEDELQQAAPRRRLLLKRKTSSTAPSTPAENASQPPSPMFFPSPNADRVESRSRPQSPSVDHESDVSMQDGGSKFKALVAKHRKARLEKEAAEVAKRAVAGKAGKTKNGKTHKQRGSSPADDSDEGSDASHADAVRRLTKVAKPTRKASKKAMEEMKRETQRMSRNMQLAHQAHTKKKVTKESLLARFNFIAPTVTAEVVVSSDQSATASSEIGSDAELRKMHETPPTSPVEEPPELDKIFTCQTEHQTAASSPGADHLVVEPPSLQSLALSAPLESDKGKGKAGLVPSASVEVRRAVSEQPTIQPQVMKSQAKQLDLRARVADLLKHQRSKEMVEDADDLDIITMRGSKRKYAAFEQLPKRKAQETQSHLALKSLAHIHDSERNNGSSMTQAQMSSSLRKAARLQARQERQQKIAELKAKGVVIQTAEERERDQQEVEDLVERARQEAAEISKREKEMAKKAGTFVKDGLDDADSDDEEFEADGEEYATDDTADSDDDEEDDDAEEEDGEGEEPLDNDGPLVDDQAGEADSEEDHEAQSEAAPSEDLEIEKSLHETPAPRKSRVGRVGRVVFDDDDDDDEPARTTAVDSPVLPQPTKTPQSLSRSARKQIPGLQMSDDLPLGLTQAFAATMADSLTQDEETQQDSLSNIRDLPSPHLSMAPKLNRLESLDLISDSQPASQTQPLNVNLSFTQPHNIPESPSLGRNIPATQFTPSQRAFEPTQDAGYIFSPFQGDRFALETPQSKEPHSTVDTAIVPDAIDASPVLQRKGRLQRSRIRRSESDGDDEEEAAAHKAGTAFEVMRRAAKKAEQPAFDKSKSNARNIVDEAAEESDDEYAGLGGASDDDANDEENEDDREMIDHDTQVGKGDEAKLASLYADRERKNDEAAVSKLLKDITTGALRRKRGANDELDLSDEEDAVARRREAKRREFAKMRRELLKDEAVGKIAEDKKKEAFLKSIEDREAVSDEDDFDQPETPLEESQGQSQAQVETNSMDTQDSRTGDKRKRPLEASSDSQLNCLPPSLRRRPQNHKPSTLAEIRESVSFLIEEPDSQANTVDLGLSDSEDDPEAYVNLDRHLKAAEADENALSEEDEDLEDFIIDDDGLASEEKSDSQESTFKKPGLPSQTSRPGFAKRRTDRSNVVNRLSLLRQSSSTSSTSSVKQAFYSTTNGSTSSFKVPPLLRRATTNSSFSSASSEVSATGVTTSRTERGHVSEEKDFIRKGTGSRRNAVNYRPTVKEERMSARAGVQKALKNRKSAKGFLGGLFRGDSWG